MATRSALAGLFAAIKSGAFTVEVGQRYPLGDAAAAHRDLKAATQSALPSSYRDLVD
jgi:NADPH:quinone reductase-like Zn-dependent oxidoreductase